DIIASADMIEIKMGQGATAGMGETIKASDIPADAKSLMGLESGEDAVIYEHFFDNQSIEDLKNLVGELREKSGGVPIGVKIGAGGNLERDLDQYLKMGVDFISIDGGQGGTHGAP